MLHKVGAASLIEILTGRSKPHLAPLTNADRFSAIYASGVWKNGDRDVPSSGAGSSLRATALLRTQLPELLATIDAASLLDIGCGDFTWMQAVALGDINYTGIDIVPSVISANTIAYGSATRTFLVLDAISDAIPQADVVLCREVLFHLSLADARSLIRGVKQSGAKHFLATSDRSTLFNSDIKSGDYRPLNLEAAPFRLPRPTRFVDDGIVANRILGCWSVADL